jgi:N-acetylmuramoyl-L-alanine amidase
MRMRGAIAGVAVTLLAAAALVFLLVGRGSNASAQSSLTVNLPPPANDRVYASPLAKGRPIVVIDAGHGGRDPGATSVSGQVREKELTLVLSQALRDELVKRGRVRVAMTREDDRYLTLDDRAAVARRLNAAMFVSIHVDSAANPLARGASVYSLSDVAFVILAGRKARGFLIGGDIGKRIDARPGDRGRCCRPRASLTRPR